MSIACQQHLAKLTHRQRDAFCLIGAGHTVKAVAHELGVSAKTVEYHVAAIYRKLGLRTPSEITRCAMVCGAIRGCPIPHH